MNREIYETTGQRPVNEAEKLLALLYAHDVLSIIIKREQCEMIIVSLGLTIPAGKNRFLLCGRGAREMIYFFGGSRRPNSNNGRLEITGYRFDVEQYRPNPLKGIPETRDALRYCAFALAQSEGFHIKNSTFEPQRSFLN